MASILMDVLKPEIDARIEAQVTERIAEDRKATTRTIYFKSVQDGEMRIDYAARQINLSPDDFTASMKKAGYRIPQEA